MRLTLAAITTRRKVRLFDEGVRDYCERLGHYARTETLNFATEALLWTAVERQSRAAMRVVLLDSRGRTFSSEQFAAWTGQQRDAGTQHLFFAIGPADGWSDESRRQADLLLSFGPMTFPHELARLMLAEQVYRAFTILAGHPYHGGHSSSA